MIYFGGYSIDSQGPTDRVAEFKNLKWSLLGNLASPRRNHKSIEMGGKIYIFGGYSPSSEDTT